MYSEDDLLPLSALTDIAFCERRAALHQLEQLWTENVATAEGHILHDKVHNSGGESRGDIRISRGLRIRSMRLGLTGVADVVEFHRCEDAGIGITLPNSQKRWTPFPVEYKRGILRHEESFEIQLCAQALCLEEMLSCNIKEGALFYGISKRRKNVSFNAGLRSAVENAVERLHKLVAEGITPPAIYEKKCDSCSLLNVCMPKTAGNRKSARKYLQSVICNL